MKPQTGAFLDKAHMLLAQANTMLEVGLTDAAGRNAYLAGLHGAQALIFDAPERSANGIAAFRTSSSS